MAEDPFPFTNPNPGHYDQFQYLESHLRQPISSSDYHMPQPEWPPIVDSKFHQDCSVFPPINHENLHISSYPHPHEPIPPQSPLSSSSSSSSSSLSSFSPSDSDTWSLQSQSSPDCTVKKSGDGTGWLTEGLDILRSKFFTLISSFRNYAVRKEAFWSTVPTAGVVVMLFWLYMRVLRGKQTESVDRLKKIVSEKDAKITQLLHQISQMNEILVARHRALAAKLN